jgi:hypothetical protein
MQEYMPDTHMILVGLLPRGDDVWASQKVAWDTKQSVALKLGQHIEYLKIAFDESVWYEPIFRVNRWMEKLSKDQSTNPKPLYPPVTYVDCGASLLVPGQRRVNAPPRRELQQNLMHEFQELSPEGHARVAACLHEQITKVVALSQEERVNEKPREWRRNRDAFNSKRLKMGESL